MDCPISKSKIKEMIEHIKKYPPYTEADKEFNQFDGVYDKNRSRSQLYKWGLEKLGIDIDNYDEE